MTKQNKSSLERSRKSRAETNAIKGKGINTDQERKTMETATRMKQIKDTKHTQYRKASESPQKVMTEQTTKGTVQGEAAQGRWS